MNTMWISTGVEGGNLRPWFRFPGVPLAVLFGRLVAMPASASGPAASA